MTNCKRCDKAVSTQNKTGYCLPCGNVVRAADPVLEAKRKIAIRHKFMDPVFMEQRRAAAIAMGKLPQTTEARKRRYTPEFQRKGVAAQPKGSPPRRSAARRLTEHYLGWCPPHLRDEYRFLTRKKRYLAGESRAMIEDQHELEMARWRRSIGAPAEALEQAEPMISDPFTAALDLAARLFRVTSEQILSAARSRKFTMPRYALAVALKRQGLTTTAIANKLGKNDHTSALHWIKRGEHLEASDRKFAAKVVAIIGCWAPVEIAA